MRQTGKAQLEPDEDKRTMEEQALDGKASVVTLH